MKSEYYEFLYERVKFDWNRYDREQRIMVLKNVNLSTIQADNDWEDLELDTIEALMQDTSEWLEDKFGNPGLDFAENDYRDEAYA